MKILFLIVQFDCGATNVSFPVAENINRWLLDIFQPLISFRLPSLQYYIFVPLGISKTYSLSEVIPKSGRFGHFMIVPVFNSILSVASDAGG